MLSQKVIKMKSRFNIVATSQRQNHLPRCLLRINITDVKSVENASAVCYLPVKEGTVEMSSAGWVLVVFLFISPLFEAWEVKDESNRRQRRSIMDLGTMVYSVTGRNPIDFVAYGNWCGLGGSGSPLDPIDECCQNHDICYDASKKTTCKTYDDKAVYNIAYKWRVADDETATCDDENDLCKMTTCLCDAVLTNCLKSNLDFYDSNKRQDPNSYQVSETLEYVQN